MKKKIILLTASLILGFSARIIYYYGPYLKSILFKDEIPEEVYPSILREQYEKIFLKEPNSYNYEIFYGTLVTYNPDLAGEGCIHSLVMANKFNDSSAFYFMYFYLRRNYYWFPPGERTVKLADSFRQRLEKSALAGDENCMKELQYMIRWEKDRNEK